MAAYQSAFLRFGESIWKGALKGSWGATKGTVSTFGKYGLGTIPGRIAIGGVVGGVVGATREGDMKTGDKAIFGVMAGLALGAGFEATAGRFIGAETSAFSAVYKLSRSRVNMAPDPGMLRSASVAAGATQTGQFIGKQVTQARQMAGNIGLQYHLGRMGDATRREAVMGALEHTGVASAARAGLSVARRGLSGADIAIGAVPIAAGVGAIGYAGYKMSEGRRTGRVSGFQQSASGIVQGMHSGRHG